MKRREFLQGLSAAAMAAPAAASFTAPAIAQKAGAKTLRIIASSNLQSLDPVWTTAPPTKTYAFMVFDQLLAVDDKYDPKPQMADGYTVEDNGRTYAFTLRDGLKFHDGEPVRSQDCIPSIQRWGARDGFGQSLMAAVDRMEVVDDKKFKIRLKAPFPLLPNAIGKSNSSQCFIMPERMAKTDPMKQVTETIGSRPYKFVKDEWVSGSKVVYAKFDNYVPRKEPVSSTAGGRIPAVDRVEMSIISDASTAMAALMAGEQDYWAAPPSDLYPVLEGSPDLVVATRNMSGSYSMLQFNHLQPPFNNPAIRQAVAMAVDQTEFLKAIVSDPALMQPCYSFYACGTPYGTEDGAGVLKTASIDKAKAALKAAGYKGEKVVLIGVMDSPSLSAMSLVTESLFRRIGINVELVAADFATMAQRRVSKEPVDKGGWSAFLTGWTGTDILNPAVNQLPRGGGTANGWFGWADDPELESLRAKWFAANDPAEQTKLAAAIQVQAFKSLPYIPLGSTVTRVAYSKKLTGMFPAPVEAYWNIGKSA